MNTNIRLHLGCKHLPTWLALAVAPQSTGITFQHVLTTGNIWYANDALVVDVFCWQWSAPKLLLSKLHSLLLNRLERLASVYCLCIVAVHGLCHRPTLLFITLFLLCKWTRYCSADVSNVDDKLWMMDEWLNSEYIAHQAYSVTVSQKYSPITILLTGLT